MTLEATLWRALTAFRFVALGYATILMIGAYDSYTHPILGWAILVIMAGWTATVTHVHHRWLDLGITIICLLATYWVVPAQALQTGAPTVPTVWVAGTVLAWAIEGGRRTGAFAALVVGVGDFWLRGGVTQTAINNLVLLLTAGVMVGYVVRLGVEAEERLRRAVRLEAANRERERLARGIHDNVLQVLALIDRRGGEFGQEAARLGATLRALVAMPSAPGATETDLRQLISSFAAPDVELALPATPTSLPGHEAEELQAAVGAALDNIRVHCGSSTTAWIFVEEEPDYVTVTVRDNGQGIAEGRLERAVAEGRLGVDQSIKGRIRDIGGMVNISSTPGEGTEVEMKVPRT